MEFRFLPILAFLTLALVASHAALSPELYWKSVLPNTPMPKAVRDLLNPDSLEEKSTSVDVGKGGVNVDAGKGKPGGTSVGVGKGGVNVNKKSDNRNYGQAAGEDQLHGDPNVALFFLEKDIKVGTEMNLHLTENLNTATLLPRQVAKSIPFSSEELPEIMNRFSVKPGSVEAEIMQNTIKECEEPGIKGEEKYCATSLESMIDFSTSKLGKNVQAFSTEVEKRIRLRKYTIAAGVKKMPSDKSVVCHRQNYVYAVFYCHSTETARAYMVPLEGADGTKAQAVAVCHTDTSAWNPKHLAFQVLKVKPGTVPICHFLPEDHIVWVPTKKPAA